MLPSVLISCVEEVLDKFVDTSLILVYIIIIIVYHYLCFMIACAFCLIVFHIVVAAVLTLLIHLVKLFILVVDWLAHCWFDD